MLERLGVKRIINATGTLTVVGGSVVGDEVMEAIGEAARVYLDVPELHRKAGEHLARLLGAEAAYVTGGAAAGLALSAGACMTGGDTTKMSRLPDTSGMKNEVIMQKLHRNMYDYNLQLAGAKIVEIGDENGTKRADLERAIGERTAAVAYFVYDPQPGVLPLAEVISVAKGRGVPVIVDAAAELPPAENLKKFIQMGSDIVLFSGGKDLGGLNNSGLLLGRRDLVQTCARLGPHSYETVGSGLRVYMGRPMKVSKEGILGLVAAVEAYLKTDHAARAREWERKADYIVSALSDRKGVKVRRMAPGKVGHPRPPTTPRVEIEFLSGSAEDLDKRMRTGEQPIYPYIRDGRLYLNMQCLLDGDEKVVASRLGELLPA